MPPILPVPYCRKGKEVQEGPAPTREHAPARTTPQVAEEEQEESRWMTYQARQKSSPFKEEILMEELPSHCRSPHLGEYDGNVDPEEHLYKFKNAVTLHQYSDTIKCRIFITTLVGLACWCNRPRSRLTKLD